MSFKTIKMGPWELNTHDHHIQMTDQETAELASVLPKWASVFPRSGNLAEARFNVPSALLRFDYVMEDGRPHIYEVEERPAGLGVTSTLHPLFLRTLMHHVSEQEDALGVPWALYMSSAREGTNDDTIFSEVSGIPLYRGELEQSFVDAHAWYVRANRDENNVADSLTSRAISTIAHEGNKRYGVELGLWEEISPEYEPDLSKPFAVKPSSGSRFEEVLLYHPDRKEGAGFATKTKVLEAIRSGKVHFLQTYHPPEIASFLGEKYRLIRRAYFVWSPCEKRYVSLGGLWMSTPTARIHGTRAAVSGVLLTA